MTTDASRRQTEVTASMIANLSESARLIARAGMAPQALLQKLLESDLEADAVRLIAATLSKRQAVWWACLCIRHFAPPTTDADRTALGAAVRWVIDPSEPHRRAAESAGQQATLDSLAGIAAMSAFWSEGSMSPAGAAEVKPPANLSSKTVVSAVLLAATRGPAAELSHRQRQAILAGIEVSDGSVTWT